MINRLNGPSGGGEHLASGRHDRRPHRGAGLAGVAIYLALGVGAEVVAIHAVADEVLHGPGTSQHRLGGQGCRRGAGPDLMGHHPLEVALQGHLLQQGPTAVGIGLEAEGSAVATVLPEESGRGLDPNRPLQHHRTLSTTQFQHQAPALATLHQAGGEIRRSRAVGRGPHLPLRRPGDPGLGTGGRPAAGRRLGALVTGEGP